MMNTRVLPPRTAPNLADLPGVMCCVSAIDQWQQLATELHENPRRWYFCSSQPKGLIENIQPLIAILRASWVAVETVKRHQISLLITDDPHLSFWCAVLLALRQISIDHVAASFYLPRLPRGLFYLGAQWAYSTVTRFVVHSRAEKQFYGEYFAIPFSRFEMQHRGATSFAQPATSTEANYICAISSSNQDDATLMAAIAQRPEIPLLLLTKPGHAIRAKIPPNVTIRVGLSPAAIHKAIQQARFVVLPLQARVPCDHALLVRVMHLSKPFIVPDLPSVSDYAFHNSNAVVYRSHNSDALVSAIDDLWFCPAKAEFLGKNGKDFAEAFCSQAATRKYFQKLLIRSGL